MAKEDRRLHPVGVGKDLLLVLQRLAAEGAERPDYAPGERVRELTRAALRGAADELEARHPELDDALSRVLRDLGVALERMAHSAAEQRKPGDRARILGQSLMRGIIDELRQVRPHQIATYEALLERLGRWLEGSAREASARLKEIREPGDRARIAAGGFVRGAVLQLREMLPQVEESLATLEPAVERVAARVGAGVAKGMLARGDDAALVVDEILEQAARALVHGLRAQWGVEPRLNANLVPAVVGAAEGLAQLAQWVRGPEGPEAARRWSRETAAGALGAVSAWLRRPALAVGVAAGVFLVVHQASRLRRSR